MVVPGMYDLPKVMAESGHTEEELFDFGITGEIVFLVVVPELGACRVPDVALSHFMAGADEFAADAMPEHWSNAPSGKWTIKRDRLQILSDSWERFSYQFDQLVDALDDEGGAVLARLNSLPTVEAERWEAAFAENDGRRHVKSQQAGLSGVCLMTLKQFCEEVEERLARWLHGRYLVCEAAQILADANPGTAATPGIDAEVLCKQMEDAIHAGKLTVRLNGLPVAATSITQYRLYLHTVLQSDVNEWLIERRAGYAMAYPYFPPNVAVPENASDGVASDTAPSEKPLQRFAAQEAAILSAIKMQGHSPLALPKNPDGKPGVKASVRAALSKNLLFAGSTVFDKAWERLTARADIVIQ